ncbi:MAG: hypothetical protein ACI4U1_04690 [Anaerovoracaceae bacterium]
MGRIGKLKSRLLAAIVMVLIAFATLSAATFAWYIYQTDAHTTDIRMAVGTGFSLQISNAYDGKYSSATVMETAQGSLKPVSTNSMQGGFQKVLGFTDDSSKKFGMVASIFGYSNPQEYEYYKTTLYVRTKGEARRVYVSDIGYEDSDEANPISTAIRVGFVVHEGTESREYIFAINTEDNPQAEYNTFTGQEGWVLDCEKTDGTTVPFDNLLTEDNFCIYDSTTGAVTLKEASTPLFTISGAENSGEYGEPVPIDVYIWLEGCDKDCTNNLVRTNLNNLAISFASETEPLQGGDEP